ncbi:MAG: tyrosine-type recombinase/integrase [Deltaproteobacteria bacterium]|nr:tyrosine-type recombinase/integrase [Deltaproteobacteria bacterium]
MNPDLREELLFLKDYLPLYGHMAKTEVGIKDYRPREAHQRGFVFCKRDGSQIACIRLSLTRAFKKHGIQGVTPHGLRKTFCSMLARQKVHPKVAQTLMGHTDISLTMRIYTEVDDDQLKEAVNLLPSMQEMKRSKFQILPGGNS